MELVSTSFPERRSVPFAPTDASVPGLDQGTSTEAARPRDSASTRATGTTTGTTTGPTTGPTTGFDIEDTISLSPQAQQIGQNQAQARGRTDQPAGPGTGDDAGDGSAAQDGELTDEQQQIVAQMAARDREVRNHEQAHAAVGGQYAGSPSYEYEQGPDGNRYAVGGEVPIDASPIGGDPQATIDKMAVVKRAALAPAEPSTQDRRVAALADQQSQQARGELQALRAAQARGEVDEDGRPAPQDTDEANQTGVGGGPDDMSGVGGEPNTDTIATPTPSARTAQAIGAYAIAAGF